MTTIRGPEIIYGTAWKQELTAELSNTALECGFRAFDTANQPKHYQEQLLGEALAAALDRGLPRSELFVQTKFTPLGGQDKRIPYDRDAAVGEQVEQSFARSLQNLQIEHVDSYLLHGPYSFPGLGEQDFEVWRIMEDLHRTGRAAAIGISNVNAQQLAELLAEAEIKPAAVQNRCYASRGWDKDVRELCRESGIAYQGFSLLTANPFVVKHPIIKRIGELLSRTPQQIVFRFAHQLGITVLTGTTNRRHMEEALGVFDFELSNEDMRIIGEITC